MTHSSRRLASALLALAAASVLVLGCGEGDGSPQGVSDDPVETAAGEKAEPLSEESARDYARAVNLRASDLPYAEAEPPEDEDEREEDEERTRDTIRAYDDCVGGGLALSRRLARVRSPAFVSTVAGGFHLFQSEVEVMPTAELAARHSAIYRSRRGRDCVERVFPRLFEEEAAETPELGAIEMTPLPVPLPGLEGAFGYRIETGVTIGGPSPQMTAHSTARPAATTEIPLFVDLFVFISGQAEISLTVSGAPRAIPERLVRNLLRVLRERSEANRLPDP